MTKRAARTAACLLLVAAAAPAFGAEPLWELGAGAGVLALPSYRGASHTRRWLLPVPYLVYRGRILKADREGARAQLFDGDRVALDLGLAASAPADSGDDAARAGMPDLVAIVELGPRLDLRLARGHAAGGDWKLALRLPLRAALALQSRPKGVGWTFSPALDLEGRLPAVDLGAQAGPVWGDRRQHAYFYDVAPPYATATRPAYRAAGGYGGWQATLTASRRIGRFWAGAFVRADSVAGAVFEPSPLVGRTRTWSAGFALAWVFATSQAAGRGDED